MHATYALPFLQDQRRAIEEAARLLKIGGIFLLTTAHPVAAGEWLTLDDEEGIFLTSYFKPPQDQRNLDNDDSDTTCSPLPVSTIFNWLRETGFDVERLVEPQPMNVEEMTQEEINQHIPYWSHAWIENYEELAAVPFVVIFKAILKNRKTASS